MIAFTVFGRPVPQGSKRHVGNGIMVESAKTLKPWRQEVTATALEMFGKFQGTGRESADVELSFYFKRPASAKNRKHPTVKPDLDKCVRAILDSLTGIAYKDDSQVVALHCGKFYSDIERVVIQVDYI